MSEKPILFSGPMVRALLAGTKTQTRRLILLPRGFEAVNEDHDWELDGTPDWPHAISSRSGCLVPLPCPYGEPGDRLWVKEEWRAFDLDGPSFQVEYPDGEPQIVDLEALPQDRRGPFIRATHAYPKWRRSRFMPREAARTLLELTAVRVQRVQEISEEDAKAEGVPPYQPSEGDGGATEGPAWNRIGFSHLWDDINGKRAPWDSNPWVWALTFRRLA